MTRTTPWFSSRLMAKGAKHIHPNPKGERPIIKVVPAPAQVQHLRTPQTIRKSEINPFWTISLANFVTLRPKRIKMTFVALLGVKRLPPFVSVGFALVTPTALTRPFLQPQRPQIFISATPTSWFDARSRVECVAQRWCHSLW